ncbi:alginate lyase family protein [Haloarcula sp. 1CSR25-25]|uniref:alginate lyase family protein n=1 Tax=Haloarcula sp. 1CSR25-25 TaxID=2862545 RepID=UPI0028943A60|nr:alginate lyase family protein [Haloarcula sp. 1CSR25-25]MDT3435477.1 alginate lyase family protein [Haloarcula sp. 1CSR25-25]
MTDDGSTTGDPHVFASGGKTDRHDYMAARKFGAQTRDLALAYHWTGKNVYARKAVEFIKHWAINPETAMRPSPVNRISVDNKWGVPASVEINITIPNFIYAAALVNNHPAWEEEEHKFESWTRTMLQELEDWAEKPYGNPVIGYNTNMRGSYIQHRAAAATYLNDGNALQKAVTWYKKHAIYEVNDDGSLPLELKRDEALDYSLNALQAFTTMAEVARHNGINLYDWEGPHEYGGEKPVLEAIADYTAPYIVSPDEWPHAGGGGRSQEYLDNGAIYEALYSQYRKEIYLEAIRAMNRPLRSGDYTGPLTATHANLFEL